MVRLKLDRKHVRYARLMLAVVYFVLLTAVAVREAQAQLALAKADQQDSSSAYVQLLRQYPTSLAALPARRTMLQLQQTDRTAIQATRPQEGSLAIAERWLGPEFRPESVDQLPLLGWLFCGLVLLPTCLIRLNGRSQWAFSALAMATVATLGTVTIWAWYGFSVGRWAQWLANGAAPILSRPVSLYIATWAMIFVTAAMAAAPLRRPRLRLHANYRARPSSPTDPLMAILYLDAQKAEKRCLASEYARRREEILKSI